MADQSSDRKNCFYHKETLLYPLAICFVLFSGLIEAQHDIPRLSDNLANAAENLEPALRSGSPESLKEAIANLLQSYRMMETDVETAYKAAGGASRDEHVAKEKASRYYNLVDKIWRNGVAGKDAAHIKADDLARGAGVIGREMRGLSRRLDFTRLDDVDQILAHAEAVLIMGEDLDLVAFGGKTSRGGGGGGRGTSASSEEGDENSASSEEENLDKRK